MLFNELDMKTISWKIIGLAAVAMILAAIPAAAQYRTKTPTHYSPVQAAELHFVDGNIGNYPIMRIGKELIRVANGPEQTLRMPLTYVESIFFKDGCTLYFDNGEFQFDKLVRPAHLENETGNVLLEGVLPLTKPQAKSLLGPEYYPQYRKQAALVLAGKISIGVGTAFLLPYLGTAIECKSASEAFKGMNTSWKAVTLGGGGLILAGAVVFLIGNSGCSHVIANYNDGLGLAYTF